MKSSGLFVVAVLASINSAAFAQEQSPASPSTPAVESNSPQKPASYTPEQLFGPSEPKPTSNNPSTDRTASTPSLPNTPNNPTSGAPAPAGGPPACPPSSQPASPNHPGVSASQFRRAGVGAEAFTRPGVSAEQLDALRPGGARRSTCAPARTIILHPEPLTPERRSPPPPDQP